MKEARNILVLNVGSSSIKYRLYKELKLLEYGNYERLKSKEDYKNSINKIFKKIKEIDIIIHRVVHGGDLKKPCKITKEIKEKIKKLSEFAPLHNTKQLMVIEICEKFKKCQYAIFDTMFFQDLSKNIETYAIPKKISEKYNIKKYGFHGLSHSYVSKNLKGKTITCHLGSGSSIAAIINGKAIDSSMGLTPLEGVVMGTRSGTIDPGIIFFLQKKGFNMEEILTKQSGLKGICGYEDFRDILKKINTEKNCKLAYDIFVYSIIKNIGSYIAVMNGLDNLIFTGAIGANVPRLRKDICKNLEYLKVKIDNNKNESNFKIISKKDSKVKVFVIKTNEELKAVQEVLKVI